MENKKALVLCGGGARGGYHIGVWEALKEIGYVPNIITGTSVGALNGALLTLKEDKLAREIWENMSMDTVFEKKEAKDINLISTPTEFIREFGQIGGIDPKPLRELVNRLADEKKMRESDIEFGLVVTATKPIKRVEKYVDEIEEGRVADYILASAACFPIMKIYEIDGVSYVDGGYTDNIPFDLALKRGATELVIVHMPGIFKIKKVENINAKVHYVYAKHDMGNFMIFNKENANKDIKLGYLDTMKAFDELIGIYYAFDKEANTDAYKYHNNIKNIYKQLFTKVPTVGTLEKVATSKIINHIKKYNEDVFSNVSDTLVLLEMAAQNYEIDYSEKYSFEKLADLVIQQYKEYVKSEEYQKMLSLSEMMKTVVSLDEIRRLVHQFDKRNIIAYLVYLLTGTEITQMQKNQVLAVALVMPSYVCSAMFIAGYLGEENAPKNLKK